MGMQANGGEGLEPEVAWKDATCRKSRWTTDGGGWMRALSAVRFLLAWRRR